MTKENSGMMPKRRVRRASLQRLFRGDALVASPASTQLDPDSAPKNHGGATGALDGGRALSECHRSSVL